MGKLRTASFFTGIGGFDVAFEDLGFKTVFQSDIDKFCVSLLREKWPHVVFSEDILTTKPELIPDAEVWTAGFPCQDLSLARGHQGRTGLAGKRSGLFFKLADLMRRRKPGVVILENVHGLLSANLGRDFAELLFTLNNLGYAVSWRLLNSRYFGVPQSRPRMYICAWRGNPLSATNTLFESDAPAHNLNERSAFLEAGSCDAGIYAPRVAFCLAATSGRHTGTDWSRTYISYENRVRRLTPLECERLQGFPDGWTRTKTQLSNSERQESLRYHALGNAVSVPTVKWIASRLHKELNCKLRAETPKSGKEFVKMAASRWAAFDQPKTRIGNVKSIRMQESKVVWPTAGALWKGEYIAAQTAPSPCAPIQSELMDIVETGDIDEKYFLSLNAAAGILRRVDNQGRTLFGPLRTALEKMSRKTLRVAPREKIICKL